MISSISSTHDSQAAASSQAAARQPQPPAQAPQANALPQDKVTLHSTADVDKDGDNK